VELIDGFSTIGGGSAPGSKLPTCLVAIERPGSSAASLLTALRRLSTPIVARIHDDRVVLDLRTVFDEQDAVLAELLSTP
jgi:L-seryl-tRNA(Ser) seleniumtransferase